MWTLYTSANFFSKKKKTTDPSPQGALNAILGLKKS